MSLRAGELIVETKEKGTTVRVKEFAHNGVKLEFNGQGQSTGKYNGGHLETVDVLQKNDGTYEFEARGVDATAEGDVITYTGKGTGTPAGSPGMATFRGEVKFSTHSDRFKWLNDTKARVEGTTNQMTNEASFKIYST